MFAIVSRYDVEAQTTLCRCYAKHVQILALPRLVSLDNVISVIIDFISWIDTLFLPPHFLYNCTIKSLFSEMFPPGWNPHRRLFERSNNHHTPRVSLRTNLRNHSSSKWFISLFLGQFYKIISRLVFLCVNISFAPRPFLGWISFQWISF